MILVTGPPTATGKYMRTSTSAADAVVDANPAATAKAVKVRREILDILLALFLMLRALGPWFSEWILTLL